MKKNILLFLLLFVSTCATVKQREPDKQVTENETAIAVTDEAIKLVDNSDIPKEDKDKLKKAYYINKSAITNSTETIEQCIEKKSKIIAESKGDKDKIKKLKSLTGKYFIAIVILSILLVLFVIIPWIRKILYWLSPAGQALRAAKIEIEKRMEGDKNDNINE